METPEDILLQFQGLKTEQSHFSIFLPSPLGLTEKWAWTHISKRTIKVTFAAWLVGKFSHFLKQTKTNVLSSGIWVLWGCKTLLCYQPWYQKMNECEDKGFKPFPTQHSNTNSSYPALFFSIDIIIFSILYNFLLLHSMVICIIHYYTPCLYMLAYVIIIVIAYIFTPWQKCKFHKSRGFMSVSLIHPEYLEQCLPQGMLCWRQRVETTERTWITVLLN